MKKKKRCLFIKRKRLIFHTALIQCYTCTTITYIGAAGFFKGEGLEFLRLENITRTSTHKYIKLH